MDGAAVSTTSLTSPRRLGLYEHARLTEPRVEHGMCVDDVARALVVTVPRADEPSPVSWPWHAPT